MKRTKEFFYNVFTGFKVVTINYLPVILTITFLLVCFVVIKAFYSKKQLTEYKEKEKNIVEKLENKVKIESPEIINTNLNTGAYSITNCLKEPLKEEELTDNMKNISRDLENIMNESYYNFAFKYRDIYTGFSLSYNSSQPIWAASTIKAPEAIYIYEEADKGNTNLEDKITYTPNYYCEGTGILKDTNYYVDYTIRDLTSYSIIHSDNIAHLMLYNKYKAKNMYDFWSKLGATVIYSENDPWGAINADDATIYMTELYNYISTNTNNSKELLNYFEKSWKVISVPDKNIKIASKSGWGEYSLHDTSLILDENPYTLVILSNRGYTDYEYFFNKVSTLIYNFHKEYWQIKMNNCTKKQ